MISPDESRYGDRMKTVWLVWLLGLVAIGGCETEEAHLVSIEVSLGNAALYAPAQTQAMAMGTYSDGVELDITADVTWSSSNTSIGDVDVNGAVFAVAPGRTDISAALDGVTGAAMFTVLEPQLQSITITGPSQFVPNGLFLQLTATGNYNNGSTRTITSAVTWSVDSTAIATIDSTGKLAGNSVGGTTVHATQGAVSTDFVVSVTPGVLTSLAITPNPVPALPKGSSVELQAMGTFSDGVENDVTDMVVWASTDELIATVNTTDDKGRVTATGTGGATNVLATFNASHGTFSDTVTVMAAPAVVVRVEIDPESLTLPLGRAENATCTAVYSDATEMDVTMIATWDSADDAVATVDEDGLVTANSTAPGTTQVSCMYMTFSDSIDVEATPAVIDRIEVSPVDASVLVNGLDVQYTAERVMSNGQRVATTCTWDAPGPATISATGLLEADSVVAGPGTVTWTCDGMSGTTSYTAFEATSLVLVIEDAHGGTPAIGATLVHRAMAQTSGPAFDVTSPALWESLTAALQVGVTPGEFTAASAGPGTVQATFDGLTATRSVTVQ